MKNEKKKEPYLWEFEFSYQGKEEKGHAHDRIIFSLGRSSYIIVSIIMENM